MHNETEVFKRFIDICLHTNLVYLGPGVNFRTLSSILGYTEPSCLYCDGNMIHLTDGDFNVQYISQCDMYVFNTPEYNIIIEERTNDNYPTQYVSWDRTDCVYATGPVQKPMNYPTIHLNVIHDELKDYCNSISDSETKYFPIIFFKV